jgi:DNA polymerase-1
LPSWNLKHWAGDCWAMNFLLPQPDNDFIKKEQPQGIQTDLFGNIIAPAVSKPVINPEPDLSDEVVIAAEKNINNTAHHYVAIEDDKAIKKLVAELSNHSEICFDTETTGIDANAAALVGMSFCVKTR